MAFTCHWQNLGSTRDARSPVLNRIPVLKWKFLLFLFWAKNSCYSCWKVPVIPVELNIILTLIGTSDSVLSQLGWPAPMSMDTKDDPPPPICQLTPPDNLPCNMYFNEKKKSVWSSWNPVVPLKSCCPVGILLNFFVLFTVEILLGNFLILAALIYMNHTKP